MWVDIGHQRVESDSHKAGNKVSDSSKGHKGTHTARTPTTFPNNLGVKESSSKANLLPPNGFHNQLQ